MCISSVHTLVPDGVHWWSNLIMYTEVVPYCTHCHMSAVSGRPALGNLQTHIKTVISLASKSCHGWVVSNGCRGNIPQGTHLLVFVIGGVRRQDEARQMTRYIQPLEIPHLWEKTSKNYVQKPAHCSPKPHTDFNDFALYSVLTRFQKMIGCSSANCGRTRLRSPSCSMTFSISLRSTRGLR